ncbi:MAG: polysaccharide biosynthesis protein [Oscillospiraceae bacterium]|nr:polysaccharide biosynthesis protein [Oscillospiraceae bacterium]
MANTVMLTAVGMLMRAVGLSFQVWLSNKIGAAGTGLYYLILSVNSTAATVAISGARFAATRIVSEELGKGRESGAVSALKKCVGYALMFGLAAGVLLYSSAGVLGSRILNDARTVQSLRILAVGLPFISAGAALSGYFTASRQVLKAAAGEVAEQLARIIFTLLMFGYFITEDIGKNCSLLSLGSTVGEIISTILLIFLFVAQKDKKQRKKEEKVGMRRITSVAMPLAVTAYARTALTTMQNVLTPIGFRRGGDSSEAALAKYGKIQGMAMPVLTFPAAIFVSLADLLVPELTRAQVNGRRDFIAHFVSKVLKYCMFFGIGTAAVFIAFSGSFGSVFYSDADVGKYIRLLACLMPVMYMDTVTDGMLRGLGEQVYWMRVNIVDSILSLILVWTLLPRWGAEGYIFILYFSEFFNFSLSIGKLISISGLRIRGRDVLRSLAAAFGAVNIALLFVRAVCGGLPAIFTLCAGSAVLIGAYLLMLWLTKGILSEGRRGAQESAIVNILQRW